MSRNSGLPRIAILLVLLIIVALLFIVPPALSQDYPVMEAFLGFSLTKSAACRNEPSAATQPDRQEVVMLSMGCKAIFVIAVLAGPGAYAQVLPAPAQEAPRTPVQILRTFRTIYIRTSTWLSKPEMLGGELQERREFDEWGLAIVNNMAADVVITVDHQPGWFYYTYSMVHEATGTVLVTGTVTAWDGKQACGKIAGEIIKRIKRARSMTTGQS